jgi:phosphomannomutase
MQPEIFKAYDVRGLFPEELDAEAARAIGRSIARHLGGSGSAVVGRDMRESGLELRASLVGGLRSEGVGVIDVGRVSTPMLYFATAITGAVGGVMITASHNPAAYNGLKICSVNAVPIGLESGLARIRDLAFELEGREMGPPNAGESREDVSQRYFDSLLELFPACPGVHLVIDAGNGIAGEAVAGLLERLPLKTTRLYFEPDGSFPNHEADPMRPENLQDLQRVVLEQGADLGVAFDGDGDRAVFVDERGEPIPADLMTALLTDVVLEQGLLGAGPGARIIHDLRSSRVVAETARARGAEPVRSRVGHAFMKECMLRVGGCFGGELSGHYYFRFPAGYIADDAAAAALLLLQALALRDAPLSTLWQPYRRYAQSGEINRQVKDVEATLSHVRGSYADAEIDELDGLTVAYTDWWFNLRPSNTEPLLRLNLEAATRDEMMARCEKVLALIDAAR